MTTKRVTHVCVMVIFVVLASVGIWVVRPRYQSFKVQQVESQKLQEIEELTEALATDAQYRDHTAASAKQLRAKLCVLTARPAEEREQAVVAIRNFLEMPAAGVEYVCNDAFYSLEDARFMPATGETYRVDTATFIVDPATNYVVQIDEIPETWRYTIDGTRMSEQEQADAAAPYTPEEMEHIARGFIAKHALAIGEIDLSAMTLETGKKEDNGSANYFFSWRGEPQTTKLDPPAETCSQDLDKNTQGLYYNSSGVPCIKNYETIEIPQISIAFTSHGQLISFSNELNGPVSKVHVN